MRRSAPTIAVGIPAHDEADHIARTLRSLAVAAQRSSVRVVVAVAADACADDTAPRAREWLHRLGLEGVVLETPFRSAGRARGTALEAALDLSRAPVNRVWLASTDADTTVHPTWLSGHQRWAGAGVDGVAGLVEVDWRGAAPQLPHRYRRSIVADGLGAGHRHVHGANLGLRAAAWREAGGCGEVDVGEDHELWHRLDRLGADVVGVDDLRVRTSGRLVGRAPDGFAAHLARLADGGRERAAG